MKSRILILLAITAIVTLSFTFVTVQANKSGVKAESTSPVSQNAPVGGFAMEGAL
jgi:hypothetical protein